MTKQLFLYSSSLLRVGLFIFAGYELWQRDWMSLFVVMQAILVSYLPNLLWRLFGIYTPFLLRVGIVFFMCSTLILGEMNNFYDMFWWWDLILHAVASIGLTIIGFISLMVFFRHSDLRSTAFFTSALAVSFAMAAAVLWEIYEFIIDFYFGSGSPMQPSNEDTMTDLIVAVAGALLVAFIGYSYLKGKKYGFLSQAIETGSKRNHK